MSKNEPSLLSSKPAYPQKDKSRRYFSLEFDLILSTKAAVPSSGSKAKSSESKITVAVSKKVAKRAVDRNRIKRIIKEALRKTETNQESMTFRVKKNIANLKSYQIEEKLKNLLSK